MASSYKTNYGNLNSVGTAITSVKVKWPAANYKAVWNGVGWTLFHNGNVDLVADGSQLAPSTFVIQNVSITDSEYKDKFGGVTPFSATIGTGSGWVLRNGVAVKGTWSRSDANSPTTWTDAKGQPIYFANGPVWVALTDTPPQFSYPSPTK